MEKNFPSAVVIRAAGGGDLDREISDLIWERDDRMAAIRAGFRRCSAPAPVSVRM